MYDNKGYAATCRASSGLHEELPNRDTDVSALAELGIPYAASIKPQFQG